MHKARTFFSLDSHIRQSRPLNEALDPALPARWIKRVPVGYIFALMLVFVGSFGMGLTLTPSLIPRSQTESTNQAVRGIVAPQTTALNRSDPVRVEVPSVSISADVVELGRNNDDTLSAPDDYSKAGWYRDSPTPGEIGPSIITGHVDNYLGPAVFFTLKDVRTGDRINIDRVDGSRATFVVDSVKVFEQNAFPTQQVYGNIDHAGLRLITCGGIYNPLTNHYSHNIVVYASLISNSSSQEIKNADR